jgi:hypothetical protein
MNLNGQYEFLLTKKGDPQVSTHTKIKRKRLVLPCCVNRYDDEITGEKIQERF